MNINDGDFNILRKKLDVMGFHQTLPVLAIPLVTAMFGDLVKTTECLRDTKKEVVNLLEEKSCWELGVEPYKCDNSRLLAELSELHLQLLKEREEYEVQLLDSQNKIRSLQTDKEYLQRHSLQLQQQLDALLSKQLSTIVQRTQQVVSQKVKKPFITTVRSGDVLPTVLVGSSSNLKCTKCDAGLFQKSIQATKDGVTVTQGSLQGELDKLQNELTNANEQLEFYKRKVESRNREIRRLGDMLSGGRPPTALAKDCCYKEVKALSQDIDLLQREKTELLSQVHDYQEKMHDAMQRALRTDEDKRKLQIHLDELKEAALQVEHQANSEINAREEELRQLQVELNQLHLNNEQKTRDENGVRLTGGAAVPMQNDKHSLNKQLNELTRHEKELEARNEKQKKKLQKMHSKLAELQKELRDQVERNTITLDEEKIRLKSERDFFQKEYLRLMSKSGSENEIEFLHAQIESKDNELRALRSDLCTTSNTNRANQKTLPPSAACGTATSDSNRSDCVQAAINRVERERDCARSEMERMRCERDTLREKHLFTIQTHAEELQALRRRNDDLVERMRSLECENRELNSARMPAETHMMLLKEDITQLKQRLASLQTEADQLKTENGQISMLNEQNERIIAEYQSKMIIAERQLHTADVRANSFDSNRESSRNEVIQLRSELGVLKQTYICLEHEKDKLLNQLDSKTERVYKLEYEHKDCKEKRNNLEQKVKELELELKNLCKRTRQRDTEFSQTSTETKALRQQIHALKASRDEAIAENGRLTDKFSDMQVDIRNLERKLEDSEQRVINMKQQLQQYVQEVKKAEDLLMKKDKERDELLDHYHSLTHDQVVLEGNNQSLEFEAAESKRQICELECEIRTLKEQLRCRQCAIEKLEDELTAARTSMRCVERQLEDAHDELRMQKIDLDARKDLCAKLDVEKDKLNAELNEVNEICKKLTLECEKLRAKLQQTSAFKELTTETTENMLERMHGELQRQYDADVKARNELQRLQIQFEETRNDLQRERDRCTQQELLANQYERQARELRQNLTEDRFCQARTREISPKMPAKTL